MASFLLVGMVPMEEFSQNLDFNDAKYPWSLVESTVRKMDFEKAFLAFQICDHDFIVLY